MYNSIRSIIFGAVLEETYKRCGLLGFAQAGRKHLSVEELKNGKLSVMGQEFQLLLCSRKGLCKENLTFLIDIDFNTPSFEIIDSFSEKLNMVNAVTDEKNIGILAFFKTLPLKVAKYATERGIYTLCYNQHPMLAQIFREAEIMSTDFINYDALTENLTDFRHKLSGSLQGYYSKECLREEKYLLKGFDYGIDSILNKKKHIELISLVKCPLGLLQIFTNNSALSDCSNGKDLACKFSSGTNYKLLTLKDPATKLYFTAPKEATKRDIFAGTNDLTLEIVSPLNSKKFNLTIE